jgi:hypothetical protein
VADGLATGRELDRSPAGQVPIRDGFVRARRLRQVPGEYFGRDGHRTPFERVGDLGVQLLALGLEQGLVGGVLDEGVLERVVAAGGVPRRKTSFELTSRSRASPSLSSGRGETAARSSWEKSRPITAAVCATSLTGARRSRRAMRES